jgi:ABC-type polysaccharide/polyol phosphate transport system ATPase subunit
MKKKNKKEEYMIEINNVSMMFNLGIDRGFSIKQWFVDSLSPSRRKQKKEEQKKNEFWALRDINLKIKPGEVVGLIGPNGAGKSTLLKIVAGVMAPTKGTISVRGTVCPMIELGAGFDMDLTARENVYLNGAVMGYDKDFIEKRFKQIIDFAELWDFIDVPLKNFSSGMTARLAFSIATLVEPEILIVDEILSVGDLAFQAKSKQKMMSMINGGTTVLYVSHSPESVKQLCNRVIWINRGRQIKVGNAKKICDEYVESIKG